jgi:hypothetical protein
MSGDLVFVDTNVLVCARDSRDPHKQERAGDWLAHLWRQRAGRLSPSFYRSITSR